MNKLIIILIAFFGFSTLAESQKKPPIMVLETTGKVCAKPANGGLFKGIKPKAGSALAENSRLKLKKDASILVLQDGIFKRLDEPGKYVLTPNEVRSATRNFDPLFAEFIKASYAMTFQRVSNGKWDVKSDKHRGDGWGATDGPNAGGWGATDGTRVGDWGENDGSSVGGWGENDGSNVGGWGVNDAENAGGWGVNDPRNGGGWGVTPPTQAGGWGVQDPGGTGGWGLTDPTSVGGWGVNDGENGGGWGVNDDENGGGWGVNDGENGGGWGVNDDENGGGWGVNDGENGGGWGIEDMTIQPTVPGGKYIAGKLIVSWLPIKDVEFYLVCILDEDLNLVHKQVTKETSVKLDATGKDRNKTYYWQVFARGTRAISPPITFNLADEEFVEDIQSVSESSNIYGTAGPELQGMMQAVAYESGGLFKECNALYEELISKYPNNDLLRMNYAAFCLRMGQHMKAKDVIERM